MTVVDVVLAIVIAYAIIQVIDWVSDELSFRILQYKWRKHNDVADFWRYVDGCYCESDYCECEDECDEVKAEAKVKTKASKGKTFTK